MRRNFVRDWQTLSDSQDVCLSRGLPQVFEEAKYCSAKWRQLTTMAGESLLMLKCREGGGSWLRTDSR
jgi:hypothetical protein